MLREQLRNLFAAKVMISIETTKSFCAFLAQNQEFVHIYMPKFQVSKFQMDFENELFEIWMRIGELEMHEDKV